MENPMKYFVFNKASDFNRGCLENVEYSPEGMRLCEKRSTDLGIFFSRVLDSREKETRWHRMVVHGKSLGDASIRFRFYASESKMIFTSEGAQELSAFLSDPTRSTEEKARLCKPYFVKSVLNPTDILLHEAKGRYLWFSVELSGQGGESPLVQYIKVYLEKDNWLSYMPEVYQEKNVGGTFLERYLYIFQSIYQDMDLEIQQVAGYFDPDAASGDFLKWLAEWIAVDDGYVWTEEQLRFLLKNGTKLYRKRGTKESIEKLVELYTGECPYIIENYQLDSCREDIRVSGLLERLYGDSPYQFTLVVSEKSVPSTKEFKTLLKIVDSAKPAHMEANVVVLKPYIFLDKYSYLGMNSVLGRYRPVNLDGFSALPFTSVVESPMGQRESEGELI